MTASGVYSSRLQAGSPMPEPAKHSAGDESSAFNLRETLKNITVREANFSEFLAALKRHVAQAGTPTGK